MSDIWESNSDDEYDFVDLDKTRNNIQENKVDEEYNFVEVTKIGENDDNLLNVELKYEAEEISETNVMPKNEKTKTVESKPVKKKRLFSSNEFLSCDQCNHSTPYPSNLKKHKRTVHEKVRALCVVCNQEFADLKNHTEVVHEKIKNFKCDMCDYSCYRDFRLKVHKTNIHTKTSEWHICPQCFVRCSDIDGHMQRVHINSVSSVYDFPCKDCKFLGKTKSALRSHVRSTHEKVMINCTVCAHRVNKWKITVHMRKHIDNKYKCKPCSKSYREKRDLAKHILYTHKNFRYRCNFCDKEVPNILAHVKFMHKEDANLEDVNTHEESVQFKKIKVMLGSNLVYNAEF